MIKLMESKAGVIKNRYVCILHFITENSPWCKSCIENSATGFEYFFQMPIFDGKLKGLENSVDEKATLYNCDYLRLLSYIAECNTEWVLLLYGNIGIENEFMIQIQNDISVDNDSDAIIYGEYSSVDGTVIRFPSKVRKPYYDVSGKFPSNLLIRRNVLIEILSVQRGDLPLNPIVGILKNLIENSRRIHAGNGTPIIHNAPMVCSMVEYNDICKIERAKKRVLIMTHELTRTGAPIVLFEACANVLLSDGYDLFLVSPVDGPLAKDFLDAGIPVMICPGIMDESHPSTIALAMGFDLVIVNTNVLWAPISVLNLVGIPVFWWIHDAEIGYKWVAKYMPDRLNENIHLYCVGQHAINALKKNKPLYSSVQNMIYGIEDRGKGRERIIKDSKSEVCEFVCSGSITERKGQDILCEAIKLLTEKEREYCKFTIVGKCLEPHILEVVDKTCREYPECIEYRSEMPRNEVYRLYANADCIICASRDDPMPTFVAEGMMFGTPSICSENTGTAKVLKHGMDGLVYENDDPALLADAIREFLLLPNERKKEMSACARATFLREFEITGFQQRFLEAIKCCIAHGKGILFE